MLRAGGALAGGSGAGPGLESRLQPAGRGKERDCQMTTARVFVAFAA